MDLGKEEEVSRIGNEEPVQVKVTLKNLYGSVMLSRMSGMDKITDRLTSVCTGLIASVRSVMDEKLSGKVYKKPYEVLNFFILSLTPARRNSSI